MAQLMPAWQAVKPAQPHSRTGTCWCGYIVGRIGRATETQKPASVFSGVRK